MAVTGKIDDPRQMDIVVAFKTIKGFYSYYLEYNEVPIESKPSLDLAVKQISELTEDEKAMFADEISEAKIQLQEMYGITFDL